jgi:stage II sporulation protein AA (anti-sigma F factor antagonist)
MTSASARKGGVSGPEIEYHLLSPGVYEVRLVGELGMRSVQGMERVFRTIFEQGVFHIVVNMEDTDYIASSGIGVLLNSSETARAKGGEMVLMRVSPRVKRVFDLMGLTPALRFVADTKEALRCLKKGAKT